MFFTASFLLDREILDTYKVMKGEIATKTNIYEILLEFLKSTSKISTSTLVFLVGLLLDQEI